MKTSLKIKTALFMSLLIGISPLGYAKQKVVVINDTSALQIEPASRYNLKFKDGNYFKAVKGASITITDQEISFAEKDGSKHRYTPSDLQEADRRYGNNVLKGTGIGALSGLALGAAVGVPAMAGAGCDDSEDIGDCKALGAIVGVGMLGVGTAVGSLIGLGIGLAIPKKETFHIVPVVAHDEKQTVGGAAVSFAF